MGPVGGGESFLTREAGPCYLLKGTFALQTANGLKCHRFLLPPPKKKTCTEGSDKGSLAENSQCLESGMPPRIPCKTRKPSWAVERGLDPTNFPTGEKGRRGVRFHHPKTTLGIPGSA
ncbi:UNVERIFIED_CONTAM: hypothetical protein K2H54_015231 [Gekko kuhli]